jgi:chromosomal replication initiation ATPase DnaA
MKLLLTALIFLSSCSLIPEPDIDLRVQSLEQEIKKLQQENTQLREELTLIQAGSVSRDFSNMNAPDSNLPDGMTFEESKPNKECLQKVQDDFIEAGNKQCRQLGYSDEDIKNKKCKLSQKLIKALSDKRLKDELSC